jgi:cytochrome c peroxidase
MLNKLLFVLLLGFLLLSLKDSQISQAKSWPEPIQATSKYASKAGFALGRALFYDPLLSADSSVSCASCHLSYTAFAHVDHPTSHGIADRIGKRNAPGLFNLAWRQNFHWDGGVMNLNSQALNPLTHPDEMGETIEHILLKLKRHQHYPHFFKKVYKQKKIETWMLLDALQQFTIELVSKESYYDQVQQHKAAFSAQQAQGFALFEQHCNRCHTAPLFFSNRFESNGIKLDSTDLGRFNITALVADKGKFGVPTLRNISHSFPYMHDGRFRSLKEVLRHYGQQLQLSDNQQKDLIAFLKTLTDSTFITNPRFQYHTLTPSP